MTRDYTPADDSTDKPTISGPGPIEMDILDDHERDMRGAILDPNQIPRPPDGSEEGVSSLDGSQMVDMQRDMVDLDEEILSGADDISLTSPLSEAAPFDMDMADMEDIEPDL